MPKQRNRETAPADAVPDDQVGALRRVTMKDVAKRAGVSQPTVSFVLNDRRDVSVAEATRARVLEAARELNFQPNQAARALRSNKSYTIGVIADRIISEPYAGQIVLGVQQAVQTRPMQTPRLDWFRTEQVGHDHCAGTCIINYY